MPLRKQLGTKDQMKYHYGESTVTMDSIFSFPLLLLLILILVLKASCFPERKYKFACTQYECLPQVYLFCLKLEGSYHPGVVLKSSSFKQQECNVKGFFSALKVEKRKKKKKQVILFSFLSNVYIESINVTKMKLFSHKSENTQAITQIRHFSSVARTSLPYP